jgi:hypothetical protein
MVNMRAGLPRLGTVCDEYRLGVLISYQGDRKGSVVIADKVSKP